MGILKKILLFLGILFVIVGCLCYFLGRFRILHLLRVPYKTRKKFKNAKRLGKILIIIGLVLLLLTLILEFLKWLRLIKVIKGFF